MLSKSVLIFFMICPLTLWAQEDKIKKTDSSVVETKYFTYLNAIRVFNRLKNQNKTYYTDYYYHPRKIHEQGVFLNNNCWGIWNEFWSNGKLKRQIDYNKGEIVYFDKKAYPSYTFENSVKLKADDIVKLCYGAEFFKKNIIWNISDSYMYRGDLSAEWTEKVNFTPTDFLFRYNIKFDNKTYLSLIEFDIDSTGKFVAGKDILGLEKLPSNNTPTFKLDIKSAIALAKQKGLIETPTKKAKAFLTWDGNPSRHFRIYVAINTVSKKDIHPKGRSTIVDNYDVYVFNPWTGAFLQKKKMKSVRGWELSSGSSTGLLPDN